MIEERGAFSICFALLAVAAPVAASVDGEAARILKENCTACHGAALQMSKLDLRTRESILKGGERGPSVIPGEPEKSRLYRFTAGLEQPSMPPGKSIASSDIEVLKRWIEAGATLPDAVSADDASAELAKLEERPVTEEERRWWAFVPPVRHAPPQVRDSGWVRNPVDAFLIAAMEAKGLRPSAPASRQALIRRAYLDLTGLPPSVAEVDAFVRDQRPDAFARIVESLLASPHYGERWARHWLDVVRYADSGGYEYDAERPNAYRYRDWVVRALNADLPYDQFVRLQLAGDEIAPDSADAMIATGFLRLGLENNIKTEMTRLDDVDDLVSTTSGAFLALTTGCARCHNHKFDPIPQKDYYRMQAVFFPTKAVNHPLASAEELERHKAANARIDEMTAPLKKERESLEKPYADQVIEEKKAKFPAYVREALATPPDKRTEGQRLNATQVEKTLRAEPAEILAKISTADLARHRELSDRIATLESQRPAPLAAAMAIGESSREAPPSYFLHRGSPAQRGSRMTPGVITVASWSDAAFPDAPADARSSHRRRGFAEWVSSDRNPLTARVMVNRIWQQHFGEGLVRTANNFGKMGESPSHPELLDWLATEFVREGWKLKAIHRLILNSAAYQMASDDIEVNRRIDPENRYLWRMPRRRLEAEAIRDLILAAAGTLDRSIGGPAVFPYIDPALFQSSSRRTWRGRPDNDTSTWRRSLYVFSKRSIPLPMLEVFDKPDSTASCSRRNRSTIAPQALALMNNSFVLLQARHFAQRLEREAGTDVAAQVDLAWRSALSRPPAPDEARRATEFVQASPHGLVDLCHALFNLNEFVYMP